MILLVSKFEKNWQNIKLMITRCAIWHYWSLKRFKCWPVELYPGFQRIFFSDRYFAAKLR